MISAVLHVRRPCASIFFFFNDTATTEIYPLSLHDALPISQGAQLGRQRDQVVVMHPEDVVHRQQGSEEHTSELQSPCNLVCRLLLEKKKEVHILFTSCMSLVLTVLPLPPSLDLVSALCRRL